MTFNYKEIFKIIIKSFTEAFNWSWGKWIISIGFSVLTGLVIPIGKETFEWDTIPVLTISVGIIVILYLLRFILLFISKSIKFYHEVYKNSTYGEAIILLKNGFAKVHHYRKTPGFQKEDFMKAMILFCNNLKEIFEKTTMSECSVSIKVPITDYKVSEKSVLKNLTRDKDHQDRDTEQYKGIKHTIIGNSAFNNCLNKVITNQQEKFYLNNDVNNSKNYLNTSKECHKNGILPYNSELVYPITPIITEGQSHFHCHGFICVDSKKKNAFDDKYSVAIIEGVADGIYDLISELNKEKSE